MNKIIIVLFLFLSVLKVNGQNASIDSTKNKDNSQFKYKSLIIPTVDNFHVWFENVCQISANILTAICDLKSLPHL